MWKVWRIVSKIVDLKIDLEETDMITKLTILVQIIKFMFFFIFIISVENHVIILNRKDRSHNKMSFWDLLCCIYWNNNLNRCVKDTCYITKIVIKSKLICILMKFIIWNKYYCQTESAFSIITIEINT